MTLSLDAIDRYHRQLILPRWGGAGQEQVGAAVVIVRGDGPAARAAARYLVGAGVARLECAASGHELAALAALNPGVEVVASAPATGEAPPSIEVGGAVLTAADDRAATGCALAQEVLKALLGLPHARRVELPAPAIASSATAGPR